MQVVQGLVLQRLLRWGVACRYWRTCGLESVKLYQIKTTAYGHRLKLCVGHILREACTLCLCMSVRWNSKSRHA